MIHNDRLKIVCRQLTLFLEFTGRWDDLLWLSTEAEARALTIDDKENAGWQAYRVGYVHSLRNEPTEVLACAARAAEHWQDNTPRNKAVAIRLRGLGHRLGKDYPAAIAAYREALEIQRFLSPESDDVAITLNSLAVAERANKDYDSAERDYHEALRIAKKIKDDESIASYTGNLANLALARERWAQAESLSREALALAEKVGRQGLIAGDCHRLAIALLKQSESRSDWQSDLQPDLQEALSLARRAVEIFTRLRHPDLQAAQETLGEIERAMMKDKG